jgi:hypothetical protein
MGDRRARLRPEAFMNEKLLVGRFRIAPEPEGAYL